VTNCEFQMAARLNASEGLGLDGVSPHRNKSCRTPSSPESRPTLFKQPQSGTRPGGLHEPGRSLAFRGMKRSRDRVRMMSSGFMANLADKLLPLHSCSHVSFLSSSEVNHSSTPPRQAFLERVIASKLLVGRRAAPSAPHSATQPFRPLGRGRGHRSSAMSLPTMTEPGAPVLGELSPMVLRRSCAMRGFTHLDSHAHSRPGAPALTLDWDKLPSAGAEQFFCYLFPQTVLKQLNG